MWPGKRGGQRINEERRTVKCSLEQESATKPRDGVDCRHDAPPPTSTARSELAGGTYGGVGRARCAGEAYAARPVLRQASTGGALTPRDGPSFVAATADYAEEQADEVEALESIFPDELNSACLGSLSRAVYPAARPVPPHHTPHNVAQLLYWR